MARSPVASPTATPIIGQGNLDVLNIPVPIVICFVTFVIGGLFLYRTRWGRHVIAVGSNQPAAYRAGIRIKTLVAGFM